MTRTSQEIGQGLAPARDARPIECGETGHNVQRNVWPHDRDGNKLASAEAAVNLMLERLQLS